jgi:hypothetical protein
VDQPEKPQPVARDEVSLLDYYLQDLVKQVNGTDIELRITLCVGGSLISGLLASGHRYWRWFAENLAAEVPGHDPEAIRLIGETFRARQSVYDRPQDSLNPKQVPQYIHLRRARVAPAGAGTMSGDSEAWWRGRLSAVDGYLLGWST